MDTNTEAFDPGGGAAEVAPTLGSEAQDECFLVAKPSYPHPLEHSGTAGLTEMTVWGTSTTVGNYMPAMNHHRWRAKQGL